MAAAALEDEEYANSLRELAEPVDLLAAEIVFNHKSKLMSKTSPGGFIESYCQKERYGGGDVLQVIYPWQGDESRALVVFDPDPNNCRPDVVQSLAEKCVRPIEEIVEFSEGQCFGKGSIFVSPRLREKLLKHFEADKIFNNLYFETGINVNVDSWCLTGYFFQLKLAEICLKRLEGEADKKMKAQGETHFQDESKQNLSAEVLEDVEVQSSPTPPNRTPQPIGPFLSGSATSFDAKSRDFYSTNAASASLKVSDLEEDTKMTTKANPPMKSTTSSNTSPDNQLLSVPASLPTSNHNPDQPPSSTGPEPTESTLHSAQAIPDAKSWDADLTSTTSASPKVPTEHNQCEVSTTSSNTSPDNPLASSYNNPDQPLPNAGNHDFVKSSNHIISTSPEAEDSAVDSIPQPLIFSHQLKKPKLGLPNSFVSSSQQEPPTEEEIAEIEGNTLLQKSAAVPNSRETSQEDRTNPEPDTTLIINGRLPVSSSASSSAPTVSGVVTASAATKKPSVLPNKPTVASLLANQHDQPATGSTSFDHSNDKRNQIKSSDKPVEEIERNQSENQMREKQQSPQDQTITAHENSGSATDSLTEVETAPQTAGSMLGGENTPLPDDETEESDEDEEDNATLAKTTSSEESRTGRESLASEGQFQETKSPSETSPGYTTEKHFSRISFEFMTTVLKEKFNEEVENKFSGEIKLKASPKGKHMILVNICSSTREQSEGMMKALNALYLETVDKLQRNVIKVQYDGEKSKLAEALIEELPQKYPDEKFIARLLADEEIEIVGYRENFQHANHVVERFVSECKEKLPATQQSSPNTSDIRLSNGAVVKVIEGDLTKMKCDAVVSSSGPNLSHEFGVSKAIALACGQKFVSEGRRHVETHGLLSTSQTFTQLAAGKLKHLYKVSYVIHAIAPSPTQPGDISELIIKTVLDALTEADTLKCKSVALPAICSGRFDVPINTCANCYWLAMEMFAAQVQLPSLMEINFVVDDGETVLNINRAFREQ